MSFEISSCFADFGMKELETEELIRRKAKGESLEEPVEQRVVSRGRGNWEGIPLNTLSTASVMSQSPSTLTTTAAVAAGTQCTSTLYRYVY